MKGGTIVRSRSWALVAIVSLAGVVALPAASFAQFPFPSPRPQATQAPAPPPDPRVAQIKAGLEKEGMKVFDVSLSRNSENDPQWVAQTAARYAQPGPQSVHDQAFAIWGVLYDVAAKDPPQTWFSGMQVWNKYGIANHVRLEHLTTLVNDLRNARTDPEKKAAFDKFYPKTILRVWDYDRREFVDAKDFINKNFTN